MFIVTEYAALKGGCTGSTVSTLSVKMLHCWKSHAASQNYGKHKLYVQKTSLYTHCGKDPAAIEV